MAAKSKSPVRLWEVPIYLPYLQPPLTAAALLSAEKHLGVKLPASYVAALKEQNGGYLRLSSHPSKHAPVDVLAGIGPRFPSLRSRDWRELKEHMAAQGISTPERIDELVPFCGDGHFHYCLDYRKSGRRGEPCVTYIDVETFDHDEVLAPNFATFLSQLFEDQSRVVGLVTQAKPALVAAEVSRVTGTAFEDQGDQDHGYRVFRAKLPGSGNWAWLSANRVREGFVRKNDREYQKLAKLRPAMVDRIPEHADCGYFLSCTDFESKAGKAISKKLEKLAFPLRAITLGRG